MATKVQIYNLALRAIGGPRLTAYDEDNEAARVINDVYDLILEEVESAHPWNFTITRVELVATGDTPEFDYDYEYGLPVGCLRVLNMEDYAKYKREGEYLITDESPAKIRYIAKIIDTTKFSAYFVTCFAVRLAAEIAYSITNNQNIAVEKYKEYIEKLKFAKALDGQEGTFERVESISWIDERGGGTEDQPTATPTAL